jgi:L-serine dehydratase
MDQNLTVMEQAVERGLRGVTSVSGLTGGDAVLLQKYIKSGKGLSGDLILDAVSKAVATNEVNAAMGTICATPTAGSAGVVPGTLFAVKEKLNPTRQEMIDYLFTAGAFGFVIANNASISGAAGGCQAEVGSASGMASAAIVEMAGGTPRQAAEAMAITLKNMLGLVCDPVAGLVEVPCVKRNAMGASNAMISADMALAGITSRIPCDEVIGAMFRIGQSMPHALKETALGGLAATPTGQEIQARIFGTNSKASV